MESGGSFTMNFFTHTLAVELCSLSLSLFLILPLGVTILTQKPQPQRRGDKGPIMSKNDFDIVLDCSLPKAYSSLLTSDWIHSNHWVLNQCVVVFKGLISPYLIGTLRSSK